MRPGPLEQFVGQERVLKPVSDRLPLSHTGASVPANINHARTVFADKLNTI